MVLQPSQTQDQRYTNLYVVNVLNIEAGPFDDRGDGVLVPGKSPECCLHRDMAYFDHYVPGDLDPFPYVWPELVAEPLTALNNRIYNPVCARLVGGGSTINAMNWIR